MMLFVFFNYNTGRLKEDSKDWHIAGNIAQETLQLIKFKYFPITYEHNFVFANIPTRFGLAWIFPVGLTDALWHTYQTHFLNVHIVDSVGEANKVSKDLYNPRIFYFRDNKPEEVNTEVFEFEKEFIVEEKVEVEVDE